jgi:hypothetical protein
MMAIPLPLRADVRFGLKQETRVICIPDPPPHTVVRVRHAAGAVTLDWPGQPPGQMAKWNAVTALFAFAPLGIAGLCAGTFPALSGGAEQWPAIVTLLVGSLLLSATGVAAGLRCRTLAQERLLLEPDALTHYAAMKGARASELLSWEGAPSIDVAGFIRMLVGLRGRPSVRVTASGLRDVAAEGRGRHAHVALSLGEDRIGMGRFLQDADREWIVCVLRLWLEAARERPERHAGQRPGGRG